MFRTRALVILAPFCVASAFLAAQSDAPAVTPPAAQITPEQPIAKPTDIPTFRSTVRRVIVDVVVRDSDHRAVHGLTAKDFEVTEDGRPQNVLSFDVHEFDTPSIAPRTPSLSSTS